MSSPSLHAVHTLKQKHKVSNLFIFSPNFPLFDPFYFDVHKAVNQYYKIKEKIL